METIFNVEGMSCEHCEKAVKGVVESLSGVSNVVVHLDTGKVDVKYDEQIVKEADIAEAIEDQGYDVIK